MLYFINRASEIDNTNGIIVDVITYPWEFLNSVGTVLQNEVTQTIISPTASIAKTSVIQGRR